MRLLIAALMIFLHLSLCSQNTYSKIVNLNLALNNELTDLELSADYIYVSSLHLCQRDTNDNILSQCTSISKYDYLGNLLNEQLLDTFAPEGQNRLLLSNERLFLTGHWQEDFIARATILLEFDTNLTLINIDEFAASEGEIANNNGIIEFGNSFYLYGTKKRINENTIYSHIISTNKETKEINWDTTRAHALWKNNCYSLQPTKEGNLIYIHDFIDDANAEIETGYQIIKLSSSGTALDSFEFEDTSIGNPRLLESNEGDMYFTSQDPPYPHQFPSNGRINKINSSLDEIEWSLLLPSNAFKDGHKYRIYDLIQTSNGDIVTCGTVWEEGPDGPLETPNNHTWNGFIARIAQSGELKWLKIYRHPNVHPSLLKNEFGYFKPSLLHKIYETTNGNFIAGGTVYYNSYQESALPIDENVSFIWLLMVNNEGCIDSEECKETIVLNTVNDFTPSFDIGTTWIYEVEEYPFPILTTFRKFMISDTTILNSKKVYIIENNYDSALDYMLVEDQKVYFWDAQLGDFQLNFDFGETNQYQIPWIGLCDPDTGTIIVHVDSITELVFEEDTLKVQHLSVEGEGSVQLADVYQNIGIAYGGLKFPFGIGLCDFNPRITKLRCFENDSVNYHFVSYPCDSTWLTTTIEPIENEMGLIYPNPSSGLVYFRSDELNIRYELYDITGQLVEQGLIVNQKTYINRKGVFILKVFSNHRWNIVKLLLI